MKITTFLLSFCLIVMGVSTQALAKTKDVNFITILSIASDPTMPLLSNLNACDDNYDGFATFDLTTQTSIILAAQSGASANYSVSYYLSQSNANTGTNPILNPSAYTNLNNQQVIYARVINNGTTQYAVGAFALMLNNLVTPIFNIGTTTICQGDTAPVLPSTSTNGIIGAWSPSTIDTNYPGTYTYMFTPNSGQCTLSVTMALSVLPSPFVDNLPTLMKVCDNDSQPNDLFTTFDIASYLGVVPDCTINYYLDANHSQPILNPSAFVNISATQTIFLVITNNTSGCIKYRTLTLNLLPVPTPRINPPTIASCDADNDGFELVDLTTNTIYIENGDPNVSLHYYSILSDALVNTNEILNPTAANVNGNVWIRVENSYFIDSNNEHCYVLVEQPIQINPTPSLVGNGYTIINSSGVQTLTIDSNGSGTYGYSLDGGPQQTSNVFSNVSLGNHTITISNLNSGCFTMISNIDVNLTTTAPPTGNTTQSFSQGATLANMQVAGQNIQWYSGVNKTASSSPLPLSTILVNGATYYASQKIGGYESTIRLPVTAQIVLNNAQFELKGLTYAPNPVESDLSLKSDDIIDSVSVYNLLGQLVSFKKCNTTAIQINVEALNSGCYFVNVTSENKKSTIKIEKK
jgi:hypothetical protein